VTRNFHGERISTPFWQAQPPQGIECPHCMPKHRADLAQSEEWRDEHGVRSEGWLHPSRDYPGLLHCNCCGQYFAREPGLDLLPIPPHELESWEPA
jgi:hypothetical protein